VLDREPLFHEEALDLLALRAGLVRDELHAEDRANGGFGVGARLRDLTPPPLPRPPAWICALTTTTSVFACSCTFGIAAIASSTDIAGMPIGTGTPYLANSCLP